MGDGAELKSQGEAIAEAADAAIAWIEEAKVNAPQIGRDAPALYDEFMRIRGRALRIATAVTRPAAVGVFGPSQGGKSYLVSALARPKGARLIVTFPGANADFLRDINPSGGRESTGIVTRFSCAGAGGNSQYPVELRLLSEADIVKIIGNAFYRDFDRERIALEPPSVETIRKRLETLKTKAGVPDPSVLSADEVFDIQEYFHAEFGQSMQVFRGEYWASALKLAPSLALADRCALFALLWWDFTPLSELYARLSSGLAAIGGAESAWCELGGLFSVDSNGERSRVNSIVDVAVLSRLGQDDGDRVRLVPLVNGKAGNEVALPRSLVAAVTAELRLNVSEQAWPFLAKADLLDFPGARSRLKISCLDDVREAKGMGADVNPTAELLLRGKVAYLFERYTSACEMAAVLLCIPWGPLEVSDLPGMIDRWVRSAYGSTPHERAERAVGLFVVLTKFDMDLVAKGGDTPESERERWSDRLRSSLSEKFGRYEWIGDWDGKPFANCHFLRNPEIRDNPLMSYAQDGTETGTATAHIERLGRLRSYFLGDEMVQRHVLDPGGAWDAAMAANDGGVSRLAAQLEGAVDGYGRERRFRLEVESMSKRLEGRLRGWFSGDREAELKKKREIIARVRDGLTRCVRDRKFGRLLGYIHPELEDLRSIYGAVAEGGPKADGTSPQTSRIDDLLEELARRDVPVRGSAANRAQRFAEEVFSRWVLQLRRLGDDAGTLGAMSVDVDTMRAVVDEVAIAAHRLAVTEMIANAVREGELKAGTRWEALVDRQATIAATTIGNIVNFLGFGASGAEQRPENTIGGKSRRVFQEPALFEEEPPIEERPFPWAEFFAVDWIKAFEQMVLDNAGFKAGRDISASQNEALGAILDRITAG